MRVTIIFLLLLSFVTDLCAQPPSFDGDPSNPFAGEKKFAVYLSVIPPDRWCYPLAGAKVISPYGNGRGRHRHSGVDLKTRPGDSIRAAFDGIVTMSKQFGAYGNCVMLRHPHGLKTLYGHNVRNLVALGDTVRAGQVVALTGRTGRATTEHLHFEVRVCGYHYDPQILFDHDTKQLKRHKLVFKRNGKVSIRK